jgi:predicted  nucleic acid-binding Zn-ribbon protein
MSTFREQLDKIQSSTVNYNTTIKNQTTKATHVSPTARQKLKEGYATNDKIRELDKSKIEKGLPKKSKRLGSQDCSPRFIKKMTNSNKHQLPKVGHSQTIDCLRQTITKKNDQIVAINKTIVTYMNKISEKENQAKAFQDLSQKLKQNLEASSEMLKKFNQMNMHFLSFYKDFENLVNQETRDVISHEDHKYK